MTARLVLAAALSLLAGCYLAHERPRADAGHVVGDAGTDAYVPRADAGVACGPPRGTLVALTQPHPFRMETTEVTREAYARFVACGDAPACEHRSLCTPQPGDPRTPMVCVTPCEARAYCTWAGRRLCTDVEWQETCNAIYPSLLSSTTATMEPRTCVLAAYADDLWSYVPSRDPLQEVGAAARCHGAEPPYDQLFDVVGNASEIVAAGDRDQPAGSDVASGFSPRCGWVDPLFTVDEAAGLVGFRCCAD